MQSIYLLIPIAMIFVVIAVVIFFWAVKNGQFDDLDAQGKRILFDENPKIGTDKKKHTDAKTNKKNLDT
ncbi:MAG: cbb3-type cytochrome oxidase maturation protein [Flavobacteriales bacterium]|jgi:cbb3-type cytochrome oxidase maturation protein